MVGSLAAIIASATLVTGSLVITRPQSSSAGRAVNEVVVALGLSDWKAVVSALLLPPMPSLLALMLAWHWRRRYKFGSKALYSLAVATLWLSTSQVPGHWLERQWGNSPALLPSRLADLRRSLLDRKAVVLVLGGGVQTLAPEFGESHLPDGAFQRLHYGIWLGRQVNAPLMVSGGVGFAGSPGLPEATVAGQIMVRDYGSSLRWAERASRDTRENARFSLVMLKSEGIQDVLLVTHSWHMKRALRAFEQEAVRVGFAVHLVPAPMGLAAPQGPALLQWLPSVDGYRRTHQTLREMVGWLAGA